MTSKEIEQAMAEALEAVEKQQAQAQLDPSNEDSDTTEHDDIEVEADVEKWAGPDYNPKNIRALLAGFHVSNSYPLAASC